ncbi:formate--tetrahydrofolate ligase [Tenacibaculum finnmarkense]|uniref:Formate--tetrahydrofolate ligase n=1 Tax=Tenacibaculum finnmarkense genomovar finnmarkense TaxID=1458503 RepID=A0AAP1WFH2_9FLAO|nr:formate--tetrahydrofolate ligase [Tenacibaculum finnmarkense]MBE7651970.1 formate--tetrahydrofolate ligase [Tenacibaculum finnmarkense genomovar finnmarkense]MBE7694315.1 formate--tetrahydrofolate ligase [Tenacibaculum finnmarkense genomovar finnmarkense]MCD8426187.1 formate--tetrahydrofolate ligase [Tenacibaculum finnmarkense genomovar finnmarkense]MCG8729979.1 formate--tetrahydrofolate ligase [Tenacibaculum finnmarkense]MCG8752081.1 formate--tetrahydrofolate ligase [Tenacibaculum finnmark
MAHLSDIEIAQAKELQHIKHIATKLNVKEDDLEMYGKYKAKLPLNLIDEAKIAKNNLILVTALTPTPAGEGKTTVSIGLTEGLNKIDKQATVVLREPSLGPVFGIKGGAAGGGYSQVVPMEDINLHFTGDFNAIEKSNNLLAALIDNNLQSKVNNLNIDPRTILWKRVIDMNDRALRQITIGLGGTGNGIPREDGFNITPASEVMAILCMAMNFEDLKKRLGDIFIGFTFDKKPVFARDLNAQDAMAILLKDAIKPNLVQTLEENPAIIHGGPFANIAQGTNTIIATKMGLSLSNYVVTEAGFGADLGAEKFLNIKSQYAGLNPKCVVLVATIRALRHHGGAKKEEYNTPSLERVQNGFKNLEKHIENIRKFNIEPVVAINSFISDSAEEVNFVIEACAKLGVEAVVSEGWEKGGEGTKNLAKAVVNVVENKATQFKPLYDFKSPIKDKIEVIAKEIYGADGVTYDKKAELNLRRIDRLGFNDFAVCMAKTQKSFSDDDKLIGRPTGFTVNVREIEIAAGAQFVIPILGKMMRMPGLPAVPASENMSIDNNGVISGLS